MPAKTSKTPKKTAIDPQTKFALFSFYFLMDTWVEWLPDDGLAAFFTWADTGNVIPVLPYMPPLVRAYFGGVA